MSVWTKTKPSANPKGSWPKVVAHRLRAWWAGLFPGDAHSAEVAGGESETLPPQPPENEDALLQTNDTGRMDDWLALVQEGAPELLVPPEQGGAPWQTAMDDMNENIDDPENAMTPSWPLAPAELSAPPVVMMESRAERPAPEKQSQLRAQKAAAARRPLAAQSARPKTSQQEDQRETLLQNRPGRVQSAREPQRNSVKAEQPGLAQESPSNRVQPAGNWMDTARQKFEELLSRSQVTPLEKAGAKNNLTSVKPEQAEAKAVTPIFIARSQAAFGLNPSRPVLTPNLQETAGRTRYRENQVVSGRGAERSPSLPITQDVMSDTSLRAIPPQKQKLEVSGPSSNSGSLRAGDLPSSRSTPAVDFDPWPELPEDLSLSNTDWMESLRSREHIYALDLEQQGGN